MHCSTSKHEGLRTGSPMQAHGFISHFLSTALGVFTIKQFITFINFYISIPDRWLLTWEESVVGWFRTQLRNGSQQQSRKNQEGLWVRLAGKPPPRKEAQLLKQRQNHPWNPGNDGISRGRPRPTQSSRMLECRRGLLVNSDLGLFLMRRILCRNF